MEWASFLCEDGPFHSSSDDCVIGRGRFYQGTVNVTKYGLPCQYWDSQEPHSHYRPPDVFPEMKNAENYCRNAGGEEPSPWCYTLDPAVRWQRCDIPICEYINIGLATIPQLHVSPFKGYQHLFRSSFSLEDATYLDTILIISFFQKQQHRILSNELVDQAAKEGVHLPPEASLGLIYLDLNDYGLNSQAIIFVNYGCSRI
uniref:Kringle domain-containing protein n=1 Tax=Timema poppense TaxID=170557 RepID=A0A7R9GZ66_TIMPO|nr:unnamed protein product [Timema poppensis]